MRLKATLPQLKLVIQQSEKNQINRNVSEENGPTSAAAAAAIPTAAAQSCGVSSSPAGCHPEQRLAVALLPRVARCSGVQHI